MSKILKLFMMILLLAACSKKDNREELTITDSEGNKTVYKVELAQSREELSTGLMNREKLDADSGMVFDLSDFNNVPTAMWMKDTKIALDMLFIDQDGMIYWVFENAEPDSVKMIVAPYPATAVLEVNAGDIKAKGIQIGDMVDYKLFQAEEKAAAQNDSNAALAEADVEAKEAPDAEETTVETDNQEAPVVNAAETAESEPEATEAKEPEASEEVSADDKDDKVETPVK